VSRSKPWHQHSFIPGTTYPGGCQICGQPENKRQHQRVGKRLVVNFNAITKKVWKVWS
jgi:hypothetical protein